MNIKSRKYLSWLAALGAGLGIATAANAAALTEADVTSGTLALSEDSTLTISSATSLDALAVSGAYTLTIDSESAATLTLTTLDIGSGTTVKLADSATLASGAVTATTVTGAGVIAYTGVAPDALSSWADAANWTGTVWVRGLSQNGWNPSSLGNAQSTLRISGWQGYFASAFISVPFAIELENDSYSYAANINNGFSYNSNGKAYFATPTLKGSGTYTANTTGGSLFIVTDDWSEFTGTFSLSGKTVWLGYDAPGTSPGSADGTDADVTLGTLAGTIRIASGKEVTITPSAGWTFASGGGFIGEGTVKLLYPWQATANLATNTKFTGTVELAAHEATSSTAVHPARMGNANSTIVFKGLTSNGGTHYINNNDAVTATVQLDGDVTIDNGNANQSVTIAKLTGTGNFNALASVSTSIAFIITKLEGYTGVLAAKSGKDTITINEVALSSAPSTGDMIVKVDSANPAVTIARSEGTFAITCNGESAGAAVELKTVGEDYGYTVTGVRRDVYWVGGASGSWRTASNWALADGTVLSAFPNGSTLGAGDNVIFTNAAEVAIGAGQAVVSKVTVNADVTFKGDSVASNRGLFFDKMTGTGKVTFDGVYVGIISANASRNFTIDNDICIASACTFFPSTLICYINGDLSGSGNLTISSGNGGGVYLYGDNSAYAGTFQATDTTRNNTGFYNGNATSSNAIFKLNSNQYNINQESTFHDSGTYYFGALLEGTFLNGAYRSPTLEVGARDDVASSAKLQGRGTTSSGSKYYFNIVKVGSNSFTVTADSSNFGDMEIKGGTLSLPSVPNYGTYVKFTGDGATLTATANSESVIPELDFSAKIMNSTSAICYDTAGSSPTWATALANSNTGGLTKKGAGTLTLSAIPQYSGATRVEEGTLVVPLGTQLGDVYVAEGATLTFDLANTTMTGALATFTSKTGDGEVTLINAPEGASIKKAGSTFMVVSGARTLTWAGPTDDDYSWSTASNWTVGGETATSAPTAVDDVVFNSDTPGVVLTAAAEALSVTAPNGLTLATAYDLTVYDDFTVTGAFVKGGKGTLTVEGTFGATGGTTIHNGAIEANLATAQSVTFDSDSAFDNCVDMTSNGYGAKFVTPNANLLTVTGNGVVDADGAYAVTSGTFSGELTGTMNLTKTGDGTFTLFGNQTFNGDVTVSGGTLKLGTPLDLADVRADFDASLENTIGDDGNGNLTWQDALRTGNASAILTKTGDSAITYEVDAAGHFNNKKVLTSTNFKMLEPSGVYGSSNLPLSSFFVSRNPGDEKLTIAGDNNNGNWWIGVRNSSRTNAGLLTRTYNTYYWKGNWGNGELGAQDDTAGGPILKAAPKVISVVRGWDNNSNGTSGSMWLRYKTDIPYIGGNGNQSFAEYLTYNRQLSFDEKAAVEQYLMAKWGINNATYAALPATADVTVAAGATLDLGGQTVTVASLNLSGTIQNGTLVVTSDNITIAATAKVLATVKVSGYDSSMTAPTGFEFSDNSDGTATLVDVRTYTWNGESGNWSDASNWNCGVAPTWRNSVVFPSGTYTVSFSDRNSSGDACWNVTINGNVTFARTVWSYLDIHENIDGSGKLTLTNMGVNNCLDNTCMTISCELEVDNSQNYSQDSYFIGWNGTTYAITGAFEASGIVNFFRPVTITGELTLDDGVNLAAGEGTTVTIGNAIVPASASATLSGSGSIAITGTVTLQGTGSTLTVPAGADVSGATFTTSVSGYEVSLDGNVYRVVVGTTVAPNATSIEYATEEEATTAAAGYTVALTAEQTAQGLQASYYTTAVVPGATAGTYVVTAKLLDDVMPEVDEGVTVTTTTVTLPVTNLKPGLCYRVVYGEAAGKMTGAGAWSEFYDGKNAPVLEAALPASGVLYYAIEAADTK